MSVVGSVKSATSGIFICVYLYSGAVWDNNNTAVRTVRPGGCCEDDIVSRIDLSDAACGARHVNQRTIGGNVTRILGVCAQSGQTSHDQQNADALHGKPPEGLRFSMWTFREAYAAF